MIKIKTLCFYIWDSVSFVGFCGDPTDLGITLIGLDLQKNQCTEKRKQIGSNENVKELLNSQMKIDPHL